jgi:hypothetical protein
LKTNGLTLIRRIISVYSDEDVKYSDAIFLGKMESSVVLKWMEHVVITGI